MILAGIDEAGYGPILGPLASASCAFKTPDTDDASMPCLWKRLSRSVARKRLKDGRRLHVNDSKQVYSPGLGLKELERSVLCFAEQDAGRAAGLTALLASVDPDIAGLLEQYHWYQSHPDEVFHLSVDPVAQRIAYNAYHAACNKAETFCVHYRVHLLLEREFNAMVDKTRNKASALFSLVARHIDVLLRTYADQNLTIVCDRQGGRAYYGQNLRMMFEDWSLQIVSESDARSEYLLTQGARSARIIFAEKAEAISLPVAAASMLAKYSREALMHRFNRFWRSHAPDLSPTAGYYNDGLRFLDDIAELRQRLKIADADLIRSR
ncbi:MAG: hypothetical protein ACTHLN_14195 [Tepidisphaeraceae bacterium]